MEPDATVSNDSLRHRILQLLEQAPDDPALRTTWVDQFLEAFLDQQNELSSEPSPHPQTRTGKPDLHTQVKTLKRRIENLQAQEFHLRHANHVLRHENRLLRSRLEGQRQARSTATQQVEAFRTLADHSPDAILRLDRDLRHRYVNPAALRLTGLSEEGLLGLAFNEISIYTPVEKFISTIQQVFEHGESVQIEIPYQSPTFQAWFDVHVVPEFGPIAGPGTPRVETVLVVARDVTKSRLAERELAYRADLLDNVHDAIVATDASLHITGWNRGAEALYGWKAEEVLGKIVYEVIPSEFSDNQQQEAKQILLSGDAFAAEMIQHTRDGQQLWVECQGISLRGEDGELTGFVSANRDVTRRQELEGENRRQRELLEEIYEVVPSGLAVLSGPDLVFKMANPAYQAITPHPEISPLGRTFDEIWPDSEGFMGSKLLKPILEDRASVTFEKIERTFPDGAVRSFTLHVRPLPWGDPPSLMLVSWETTEVERALDEAHRRAAEAEAARQIFEAMMEYIPEGITIASTPEMCVLYNSKYGAGLGPFTRSQLENISIEAHNAMWNMFHMDGVTPLRPDEYPLARAARTGEVIEDEEYILKQSANTFHLLCNAGPIRDQNRNVLGAVVATRDITDRKRNEQHQSFLGELGRMLVALTTPLDILTGLSERLGQHLELDRCLIVETGPDITKQLILADYAAGHLTPLSGTVMEIPPDQPALQSLRNGKAVVVGDAAADPRVRDVYQRLHEQVGLRSLVLLPWLDRERRWAGTLIAGGTQPRQWRPDEISVLGAVADLALLALENARLFQDLREFRQRFEIALRNAPISVYTNDRDLRYTWMFNTQYGISQDQVIGKRDDELIPPEDAAGVLAIKQAVLETGIGMRKEIQVPISGRQTIFDMTVEPLLGPQGEVAGVTVAAMEVTEQRRMEAEAMHNLAQIEVQRQLIGERELERTRIARELHDGPLQELIATSYTLVVAMDVNEKQERLAKMRAIQATLQRQVQELRRFCYELRPPALGPFGLEKTIRSHAESLAERYPGLIFHLDLQPDRQDLNEELRLALFRVYQELLNNVVRHSQAGQVWVRLRLHEDHVELEVEDDGAGFELPDDWVHMARSGHLGLVGVQERVEIYGGSVEIDTHAGQGTRVRVVVKRE